MPQTSTAPGWLVAPPPEPVRPEDEVRSAYPRLRLQVFLGIFIGYAGYYLIRNNIPLVGSLLIDEGRLDELGIGIIANAALIAYGFSKFPSATVSDSSNARYFLPIGLLLSAVANLVIAFVPAVSASLALFAVVMFINGWFQGMGWPPCGRVLVHGFSTSERGIKTSIWNVAHNVGGFGVGVLAALGLSLTGDDWTAAFWLPAIVAIVVAVVAFFLIRDTPASQGLPTIETYRDDPAKVELDEAEDAGLGMWAVVRKHVLRNRTLVLLALANVFVYALRYGVLTWTPIYLSQVRGASLTGGIAGFSLFELAGIVGTLLCGWASDKVFRGNRSITGIVFMAAVGLAVAVYWLTPASSPLWVSLVAVTFIGGLIYGPVMLIGLQALDLSPRRVAGTPAGFTGLFGYVIGATLASSGIGLVIPTFGWDVTFIMLPFLLETLTRAGPTVNSWVSTGTPPAVRGAALGWLSTAIHIGQLGSPLLSSPVAQASGTSSVHTLAGGVALAGGAVPVAVLPRGGAAPPCRRPCHRRAGPRTEHLRAVPATGQAPRRSRPLLEAVVRLCRMPPPAPAQRGGLTARRPSSENHRWSSRRWHHAEIAPPTSSISLRVRSVAVPVDDR